MWCQSCIGVGSRYGNSKYFWSIYLGPGFCFPRYGRGQSWFDGGTSGIYRSEPFGAGLVAERCFTGLPNRVRHPGSPVGCCHIVQAIAMKDCLFVTTIQCSINGQQCLLIQSDAGGGCIFQDLLGSGRSNNRCGQVGFA